MHVFPNPVTYIASYVASNLVVIVDFKILVDLYQIYMLVPLGMQPLGLGICIRQIPLAHVLTVTYKDIK